MPLPVRPGGLHCRRQCPGRGHTQQPRSFGQCPLPLPANLSVLLTLPCPRALSLSFHLLPGRTCPQAAQPTHLPQQAPARYRCRAGWQHNHARNVKPFPPRGSPGGQYRCLVRPRGLRCWGKYPGSDFPPSPRAGGGGQCPLLVRPGRSALPETVPRGEALHISAPRVIRQCPLPLPANLSVLLALPCPGALPLSFHLLPSRACPQSYQPTHLPQQARRGIVPGGPSSIITPET